MALNTDLNPQNGVQGTSYLYDFGTSPNTRTALSQKIRVLTPAYGNNKAMFQMGVLSTFTPNEGGRSVEALKGIGFGDQIAELVPGTSEMWSLNFSRALLYLANLWQATGYAAGVDGPVRALKHHRWPFDVEQQLVFSTLADADLGVANVGRKGKPGEFDGGVAQIQFPQVTPDRNGNHGSGQRGHSAIITMYETCWFTGWSTSFEAAGGILMESGDANVSDVHDFASVYGEFLATGNDPTIGQLGSIRFQGKTLAQTGSGISGGAAQSAFVNPTP